MKVTSICFLFLILFLVSCQSAYVQHVETGIGNDFVGSYSNYSNRIYYEHSDLQSTYSEVRYIDLNNPIPQTLVLPNTSTYSFFASPNVVEFAGQEYLYYISAEKFWGNNAQILRVPLNLLTEATPIKLPLKYGAYSLSRITSISNGKLVLILRSGKSRLFLSMSNDGVNFDTPVFVGSGTMPALAEFSDGTLLVSYQSGQSVNQMRGQIRLALNNTGLWSHPSILPHEGNVHDLYPVQRQDGNIDIYYSVAGSNNKLALYRVCLNKNLHFGSKQRLLATEDLSIAKSAMFYTKQGRILSFSNQSDDLVKTNLTLYPLSSDAPDCPMIE